LEELQCIRIELVGGTLNVLSVERTASLPKDVVVQEVLDICYRGWVPKETMSEAALNTALAQIQHQLLLGSSDRAAEVWMNS
jgi:hypothetical protein